MGIVRVWILAAAIAVAGADAREAFNTTPPPASASFSCVGRRMGFYADVESNCRAYHMCDDHGNHFTHHCPEDTAFRQDAMVCDHAYLVDCQASVNNAPTGPRFGLDANHDAPPSSFVEPHGEGSNAQGFARSFRINPDDKAPTGSKYPTFVLNSSVFLTNRNTSTGNAYTSTTRPQESETSRPKVTPTYYKPTSTPAPAFSASQEKRHFASTTSVPALSEELLPPLETSKPSGAAGDSANEEFSFLVPPPTRSDNEYHRGESAKGSRSDNHLQPSSASFQPRKSSREPSATKPDGEADRRVPRPVNFLEPPPEKPSRAPFARTSFNFRGDDYPYVETLRSIQNNGPSTSGAPGARPTEASIFPVPRKQLAQAGDAESDPYYPRVPTTTEAYYTPRQGDGSRRPFFATTRRPPTSNAKFEIPAVLPDLNSLEDLLDRRKFFFIPQVKSK